MLQENNVYTAKVVEIVSSGVMVELYNGMKPALLPNSQIDTRKVSELYNVNNSV